MAYESRLRSPLVDRLFDAILSLRTREECYRFFEELCTVREVRALAQRFEVARLLRQGCTYDEIVARTGMSTATISRIKRFVEFGADGYNLVLTRLGVDAPAAGAQAEGSSGRGSRRPTVDS